MNVAVGLWTALALLAAGRGTVLVNQDVIQKGDDWTIVLQRLQDGPTASPGRTDHFPRRLRCAYVTFDIPQTPVAGR